jgi:DNA-directed RNA polymerase subunit RPC12/RpoP
VAQEPHYPNYQTMNCPNCNHFPVAVIQVNNTKTDHTTRRKSCPSCNHKWFTVELQIMSWAVKWEKVNPDYRFGGKPTPCIPVSILYGDNND